MLKWYAIKIIFKLYHIKSNSDVTIMRYLCQHESLWKCTYIENTKIEIDCNINCVCPSIVRFGF